MRHAAPRLTPLLADTHPARDVTRNLFRPARLASRPGDEPVPRTEVDMAQQWWEMADGSFDGDHRERARLLKALAEHALSSTEPLSVNNRPARAVDALVASETLRDRGNDRVVFRYDAFDEWAIANLLYSEPTTIERLALDRPASAVLARGAELASRMIFEHGVDVTRWQLLVERLSRKERHGSWRRAVLLALVRSEVSSELLTRAAGLLLGNRAGLLRELIRIVMAVEVEPASKLVAAVGVDLGMILASLNVPSRPSWHRLILWLLSLGHNLPVAAIPDVVDLYTAWSSGMLGQDQLTPLLMQWLYRWLIKIEAARDAENFRHRREPFGGEIDHDRIGSLESDLRTDFFLCRICASSSAHDRTNMLTTRGRHCGSLTPRTWSMWSSGRGCEISREPMPLGLPRRTVPGWTCRNRIDSFLPVPEKLVESSPSLFVAVVTLNLLEVSPRSTHLPFIVAAAKTWLESYPDDSSFWVHHGIGRHVCMWIEEVWRQEPALLHTDKAVRFDVDRLLEALIS